MRLSQPAARQLIETAYTRETGDASILYEGMCLADLAHVLELMEIGVIPDEAGGDLLSALLELYPSPPLDFGLDPALGDLYSNREAYLKMLGAPVGWLSAGRARREATTVAFRIAVRVRLLTLASALADFSTAALDLAEAQRATLFPDYTYLQPAQPTTFGHYLLTFLPGALRDLDRLRGAFARTNASPAGSGSVNGSRLPLDRGRLAVRLGFESVIPHPRDAMWQADGPIEIAALLTAALVNQDRLAEDLQIFSTAEFGLVELADRHTRGSVIMPQKKNPYALAYVRGACGEAIGTLAAQAALGKTPSGQIDNRIFAYGDVPRAVEQSAGAIRLMADVLRGLVVRADVAARRSGEGFSGATDLADEIMLKCGLDYKAAHDLVARAVSDALESGQTSFTAAGIEAAAQTSVGRALGLSSESLRDAIDPARIVAARTGLGGAAEPAVLGLTADFRRAVVEHVAWREAVEARLAAAQATLLMAATALRTAAPGPGWRDTSDELPPNDMPQQLDDMFGDLPRPHRRRHWGE